MQVAVIEEWCDGVHLMYECRNSPHNGNGKGGSHDKAAVYEVAKRFQEDWPAAIDDYLPRAGTDRRRAVIMLSNIDLELRWTRDRAARAEDYLRRYPEVWAEDRQTALELIEAEYRLRREHIQLGEFCRHYPAYGDVLLTHLRDRCPSSGERFLVGQKHAEGELGEVFVAEDAELHRKVALKRIKARYADRPASRARFLVEAEITSKLEHPGIAPVYGSGHDPDGRPFYAMRFIDGVSLRDAIHRFHAEGASLDPSVRALAFRDLLGRLIAACDTMDYAHSRGIINRDLKPEHIVLGPYGGTLVVDWGLAKALGRADVAADPTAEPLMPESGRGSSPTQVGSVIGTPGYMSPEQAAGELDRVGPASDVYSLGAILYTILTGRVSIEGRGDRAELQRVRRGEFPPPRAVRPAVPRALEAICLKAMALEPDRRYDSPRALSADLRRWLADEPTSAYREPLPIRAARCGRRHKTTVVGVASSLAVLLIAMVTTLEGHHQRSAALIQEAVREARAASLVEDWQRVESLLTVALTRADSETSLAALKSYVDRGWRHDLAWAYTLRGLARNELGRSGDAGADFRRALGIAPIKDAEHVIRLRRGIRRIRQRRYEEAIEALDQAKASRPEGYQSSFHLWWAHQKLGNLDEAAKQLDEAIRLAPAPRRAPLLRARAWLLCERQDPAAALRDIKAAEEIAADSRRNNVLEHDFNLLEYVGAKMLAEYEDYGIDLLSARVDLEFRRFKAAISSCDRHLGIGRRAGVTPSCDRHLDLGPPGVEVFWIRGRSKAGIGDDAAAVEDYTRALGVQDYARALGLTREPDDKRRSEILTHRGWARMRQGKWGLSLDDQEEAIRLHPQNGDAYIGRACARVMAGRICEGVRDVAEGLRLGPGLSAMILDAAYAPAQFARLIRLAHRIPQIVIPVFDLAPTH